MLTTLISADWLLKSHRIRRWLFTSIALLVTACAENRVTELPLDEVKAEQGWGVVIVGDGEPHLLFQRVGNRCWNWDRIELHGEPSAVIHYHAFRVPAGDYSGDAYENQGRSAPLLTVEAGKVTYFGDYIYGRPSRYASSPIKPLDDRPGIQIRMNVAAASRAAGVALAVPVIGKTEPQSSGLICTP